jgi:hypothetical protein
MDLLTASGAARTSRAAADGGVMTDLDRCLVCGAPMVDYLCSGAEAAAAAPPELCEPEPELA